MPGVNAIHRDHATTYHFEKTTGIQLDARTEYTIDTMLTKCVAAAYRLYHACRCGDERGHYGKLGSRLEVNRSGRIDDAALRVAARLGNKLSKKAPGQG